MADPAGEAPEAQVFRLSTPDFDSGRRIVRLCRTERMYAQVQVVKSGGESSLHSHTHLDGFWMVMKGTARFYTDGDRVIADLNPGEGVLVPRGYRYWFESTSPETLELLQIETSDISMGTGKQPFTDVTHYKADADIRRGTRVE